MNKYLYVLGVVLIAGFCVLGGMEMQSAQTPYVTTLREARAAGNRPVQLIGSICRGKTSYNESIGTLTFKLSDSDGKCVPVNYHGVEPANFDSAKKAVVRGVLRNGKLDADQILLKCPSKYSGE